MIEIGEYSYYDNPEQPESFQSRNVLYLVRRVARRAGLAKVQPAHPAGTRLSPLHLTPACRCATSKRPLRTPTRDRLSVSALPRSQECAPSRRSVRMHGLRRLYRPGFR